mgnify:CR=1 FL=1
MTTKERTDMRKELVSLGYAWEYVDEWPARISYYVHREVKNPRGAVVRTVGTEVVGLPGLPTYAKEKAKQGLFPWPPSETCPCSWCRRSREATGEKISTPSEAAPAPRRRKVGPNYGAV